MIWGKNPLFSETSIFCPISLAGGITGHCFSSGSHFSKLGLANKIQLNMPKSLETQPAKPMVREQWTILPFVINTDGKTFSGLTSYPMGVVETSLSHEIYMGLWCISGGVYRTSSTRKHVGNVTWNVWNTSSIQVGPSQLCSDWKIHFSRRKILVD